MPHPKCGCAICQHHHDFQIPPGLVNDLMQGGVAFFAGAGISTERPQLLSDSFSSVIAHELGVTADNIPFPELMQMHCQTRDGRLNLIHRIRERFSYIRSFPELYRLATRFHAELSTFFPVDTIITTNWDTYFEDECAATPFVTDEDMALWAAAERKVIKIHGSIQNLGSIIATTDDYRRSKKALDRGLIGSRLKSILADKTLIYVGYSYRDDDFAYINNFVSRQLGVLGKQAYIVTIDDSNEALSRYNKAGLIPIFTDATYFLAQIKEHAQANYCFLPDRVYSDCLDLLIEAEDAHKWLYDTYNIKDNPEIVYCAYYQDGLQHLLERVMALRKAGVYSDRHYIQGKIHAYQQLRKAKSGAKRYGDVAYIDGYINGLLYLLISPDEPDNIPPLFYGYGLGELMDKQAFAEALGDLPSCHKAAFRDAKRIADKALEHGGDLVIHHIPQL